MKILYRKFKKFLFREFLPNKIKSWKQFYLLREKIEKNLWYLCKEKQISEKQVNCSFIKKKKKKSYLKRNIIMFIC